MLLLLLASSCGGECAVSPDAPREEVEPTAAEIHDGIRALVGETEWSAWALDGENLSLRTLAGHWSIRAAAHTFELGPWTVGVTPPEDTPVGAVIRAVEKIRWGRPPAEPRTVQLWVRRNVPGRIRWP